MKSDRRLRQCQKNLTTTLRWTGVKESRGQSRNRKAEFKLIDLQKISTRLSGPFAVIGTNGPGWSAVRHQQPQRAEYTGTVGPDEGVDPRLADLSP